MAFRLTPKNPAHTSLSLPGGIVVNQSGLVLDSITPQQRKAWGRHLDIAELVTPPAPAAPLPTGVFVFNGTETRGFRGILGVFVPGVPRKDLTEVEIATARKNPALKEV
jgi:hypothetical protein